MIRKYLDSLFFRSGIGQIDNPLNKFERVIHTIDYWLIPFTACEKWTIKILYYGYSELFLINDIPIGRYRKIMKGNK